MRQMRNFKIGFIIMIGIILIMGGCDSNEAAESEEGQPVATIEMDSGDTITMELYPDTAPNTVNNFISLIEDDYYDDLIFHRVIPGFMIQGGDPDGNGGGGPGYAIEGEFSSNGIENDLKHERGIVSMARSGNPDSAGSQFFIMTDEATHLDGEYAAFGKVIDGMDTVDDIVSEEVGGNDKPADDQIMKTVEVDLNGYDAEEPEKM